LVACLAWPFTSYSGEPQLVPGQIYTTGNLVQPTVAAFNSTPWVNGVFQNSLTCWAPGGPGYCGPNPIVRPGNNINFSYGWTDLYQIQSVAAVLPNSGTGLRVNGYNFGFTAKNGNGWDDGRVDVLYAYVQFNDTAGKSVYNNTQNLTTKFNWTTFNYSETFSTPFASKDLGTVQYGFVGKDNNYWAGPYGPEVTNISFSLKYSVDPCSVNVLSSPSCPGYLNALSTITTVSSPTLTTASVTTTNNQIVADSPRLDTSVTLPASSGSSTNVSLTVTSNTAVSATPTATNPQPKIGEVSVPGGAPKTLPSSSQILSLIRNEQQRISNIESSAVQQAINEAQQQAEQAQAESMAISNAQIQSSAVASQTALPQGAAPISQSLSNTNSGTTTDNKNVITVPASRSASIYSLIAVTPLSKDTGSMYVPPATSTLTNLFRPEPPKFAVADEAPRTESLRFGSPNPVNNLIMSVPSMPDNMQSTTTAAVNAQVRDNELAAGINLDAIAREPTNFQTYMAALPDAPFYAPREVYRNQRVVDNARAQRILSGSSDAVHRRMVEQQYETK